MDGKADAPEVDSCFARKLHRDHLLLAGTVKAWRDAGETVVFSNGVFDLLHVGHVRCLRDARSKGDRLVVALNSDRSTRENKGPELPIVPEEERAEVISALTCVDAVTIFDEATVDGLLSLLRPDIYAKGREYTPESIPETGTVRSYGGQLVLVGDPKSHSTRWIIEKIRKMQP